MLSINCVTFLGVLTFVTIADASPKIPDSFDWRTKGVISSPRNLGQSDHGDFFTVAAVLESTLALKTGKLVRLSAAQLEDCCQNFLNPFQCVEAEQGLCYEKDYPISTGTCRRNRCHSDLKLSGVTTLNSGDEKDLLQMVLINPVLVVVNAGLASFQLYRSGVYDDPNCVSTITRIDHSMLLVGYGTLKGKDYWILQNNWGVNWGMDGYMYMARNKDNMCGVATEASYPTLNN